jgi:hypothetical protein
VGRSRAEFDSRRFGEASPHYTNFVSTLENCKKSLRGVDALVAVFVSAKGAFDGGYVFNVELMVSGEVFGDFVAMAKQALWMAIKMLRPSLHVQPWKTR